MGLLSALLRRLVVFGVTGFFALLVIYLITLLVRNPQVVNGVLAGIGELIRDVFSVAGG